MTLRQELTNTINRFRTVSVAHPIGFIWRDRVMTFYQLGKKWNMSKLFSSCFMPNKAKGILLPDLIKQLLLIESAMQDYGEDLIIVPKMFGFDLMKPNDIGDPLLLHEIRFFSIKHWLVLMVMRFVPLLKPLIKMVNKEFDR